MDRVHCDSKLAGLFSTAGKQSPMHFFIFENKNSKRLVLAILILKRIKSLFKYLANYSFSYLFSS